MAFYETLLLDITLRRQLDNKRRNDLLTNPDQSRLTGVVVGNVRSAHLFFGYPYIDFSQQFILPLVGFGLAKTAGYLFKQKRFFLSHGCDRLEKTVVVFVDIEPIPSAESRLSPCVVRRI